MYRVKALALHMANSGSISLTMMVYITPLGGTPKQREGAVPEYYWLCPLLPNSLPIDLHLFNAEPNAECLMPTSLG